MKKQLQYGGIVTIQLLLILLSGMISRDRTFAIGVSLIGVLFNFLVSMNQPVGFLFGVLYALANGILAYETKLYASVVFMLFLQAPMAIYSYISWKKKKQEATTIMKEMTGKQLFLLGSGMCLLGIVMYQVLLDLGSTSVLPDTVFFVFSVSACLLLAFCFKNAYVITLFSGLGGTFLWTYQMVHTQTGFSIAVFYMVVALNSVIAVYQHYFSQGCRTQNL
ncbi:MAG: nicotinamide riboside transporter PnuC [Cellulosilyticaceae bacterium]